MTDAIFGTSIPRREDVRLGTGRGDYTDDVAASGTAHAVFVRAPYAAARITSIDTGEASAMPGVRAVLTAADLQADGVPDFILPVTIPNDDGPDFTETTRALLSRDMVRYVGEPVAMVLADTLAQAVDAAEAVDVEYEPLDAITTIEAATAEDAPQLWPERPGNVAYRWKRGDKEGTAAALAASAHVTKLDFSINRVSANALEPRAAFATIDETGRTFIRVSHQSPHAYRNLLCNLFGLQRSELHVVTADVGGSFGMKAGLLREETLVFWAARLTGGPVKWTATRTESLISDEHGRDIEVSAQLGLDENGIFTGLDVRYSCNIGAYFSARSLSHVRNAGGIAGVYRTPKIFGELTGYFTNTQTIGSYRGAGRPEASFIIERLIDIAAMEIGADPADLRRRNLIAPEQMPYKTPFTLEYDSGEFDRVMVTALDMADYAGFPERLKQSQAKGMLRGIGISNSIEVAAGPFAKPQSDFARVELKADGTVALFTGANSVGQGHETSMSGLVAGMLSVPLEDVAYIQGDTDAIENGKGNGGSGALSLCGPAVKMAVDEVIEKGVLLAAAEFEVAPEEVEFLDGHFRSKASNRSLSLAELAALVEIPEDSDGDAVLSASTKFSPEKATYPNGCHICEVEIDPETGRIAIVNYSSVEDIGNVLNPLLAEGQIRGGVAQGIGQALFENVAYSAEGQLESGSFMDYAMPRSTDIPPIKSGFVEVPCKANPLGVKGVGEAGTVGSLSATMNAICHALAPAGIRNIDTPATPDKIWRALQGARQTA